MVKRRVACILVCIAVVLSSCTTGQHNVLPDLSFTPTSAVLEFAVGTVNFAGTAVGLNVLETDRAATGYTAIPDNTIVLTGPAGFAGPSGSADPGSGTALVPLGAANDAFPLASAFTQFAAADGTGVGPPGSSSASVSPFPVQPQFLDAVSGAKTAFPQYAPVYGGPPAYPPPSGSMGYPEGFYLIALSAAPPAGSYALTISYSQNGNAATQVTTASLVSTGILPTLVAPSYTSDGKGGGGGNITLPAGVVQAVVNIADATTGTHATALAQGSGSKSYTIPDSLAFGTGDTLIIQAIGFDYNSVGLTPPYNLQQSPALPHQADVTIAPQTTAKE